MWETAFYNNAVLSSCAPIAVSVVSEFNFDM